MSRAISMPKAAVSAAVLVIPLVYVTGVYDFTRWPRLLLLQALTAVLLAGLAVRVWRSHAERGNEVCSPARAVLLPVAAFTGWQLLAILWADNPIEGIQKGSQLLSFVAFSAAAAFTLSRDDFEDIARLTAIPVAIVSAICICQYWGIAFSRIPTAGNPSATFGYRNYLATYLVVTIPPIAWAAWSSPRFRAALFGALLLALTALLCTRTRGAWLGLATVAAAGAVIVIRTDAMTRLRHELTARRVGAVLVAIVLVGTVGLRSPQMANRGQFGIDEQKRDAVTAITSTFSASSSRGRTIVWSNTLEMVMDHPLVGVGLGGWQFAYPRYDAGEWITDNVAPQRPHNDLLWILSETGIVGLALYLWLLVSLIRAVRNRKAGFEVSLLLGIAAYVVHSLFSFPSERVASPAMMWLWVGGIAATSTKQAEATSATTRAAAALALVLILSCAGLSAARFRFDGHYAKTVEAWMRNDWHSVVVEGEKAAAVGPLDFRVYQLLGAGYEQTGRTDEAETAYRTSLRYHPNEGHLPLADLLLRLGRTGEAGASYAAELDLYPRSVNAHLGLVRTAAASGDTAGARVWAERALRIRPDNAAARSMIEGAAVDAPESHARNGDRLGKAGRWEEALQAHREAAAMAPDIPRYHNNVGVALTRLGRYSEAIDAFNRAIAADTDYARAYRNLGDAHEKAGNARAAVTAYNAFAERWTGDPRHADWARDRARELAATP